MNTCIEYLVARSQELTPFNPNWLETRVGDQIHVEYDASLETISIVLDALGIPRFTKDLLDEMLWIQKALKNSRGQVCLEGKQRPFHYVALKSRSPGVFNLGGDLNLFARCIERNDREALTAYGVRCINAVWNHHTRFDLPIETISLVQGQAFGGGLEAALASSVIVAERSAQFSLPEVMFGLFPGMGALPLLSQRVGARKAREMMIAGDKWTAEMMREWGVIDLVVEDGSGESVICDLVRERSRKRSAIMALDRVFNRKRDFTFSDLEITLGVWIDTALSLSPDHLRAMQFLSRAQVRRFERVNETRKTSVYSESAKLG